MTGVGAQSVAMGGTGVAAYYGAENVIVNPAMIGKGTGTEFAFGGTLFKPNVSNNGLGGSLVNQGQVTSSGDTYMIPDISLSSRINDNWSFGLGMYGTSGMGVDYRTAPAVGGGMMPGFVKAQSSLQIMRIVPTIAYNTKNAGIGFSPIIQYGALDINHSVVKNPGFNPMAMPGMTNPPVLANGNTGSGMSSDLGMGFSLGGYYDVNKNFTLGASYTSSINMKYKGQLSTASEPFTQPNGAFAKAFADDLEQPAEIKAGAAYTMGNIMLTGDFKQIKWGDAKGYKDFGWQDQNVIALGLKYSGTGYWVGAGYNKADNPIKKFSGTPTGNTQAEQLAAAEGATKNFFNNIFFPATTEQHFSVGGGYDITKNVSLEGAIMYAPEVSTTVDTTALTFGAPSTNTTKHSQMAYTIQAKYKF
jgi:long-chain fatty acid transport protein